MSNGFEQVSGDECFHGQGKGLFFPLSSEINFLDWFTFDDFNHEPITVTGNRPVLFLYWGKLSVMKEIAVFTLICSNGFSCQLKCSILGLCPVGPAWSDAGLLPWARCTSPSSVSVLPTFFFFPQKVQFLSYSRTSHMPLNHALLGSFFTPFHLATSGKKSII